MSFWEILICVIISIGVTIGLLIERDKAIESKVKILENREKSKEKKSDF